MEVGRCFPNVQKHVDRGNVIGPDNATEVIILALAFLTVFTKEKQGNLFIAKYVHVSVFMHGHINVNLKFYQP